MTRVLKGSLKTIGIIILFVVATFTAKANQLQPSIDVVFTVDLSGSTNGIIDDIRDKIWDVQNQVNYIRPTPNIRFGIVGYGRPSFGLFNNCVKVIIPLTKDVDLMADELYKIKANIEKGFLIRVSVNTVVTKIR